MMPGQWHKAEARPSAVLPFEFNAVDGTASDLCTRYLIGGVIGLIGTCGLALGHYLLCGGRSSATAPAAPSPRDRASQSLPKM